MSGIVGVALLALGFVNFTPGIFNGASLLWVLGLAAIGHFIEGKFRP